MKKTRQKKAVGKKNALRPKKKASDAPKLTELEQLNLNAAGIDIGSSSHFVSVPEGCGCAASVREFRTFTADLYSLADWLKECGVDTVAMESTGVYWIPVFEVLDARGFKVLLVDPRQTKNVSGRKSDVLDCQWIRQLHTYGLLSGAFRPADQVCVLRSYVRQRTMLVESCATHTQHMQKALHQMNLLLHNVVNDITGVTGMAIIRAILKGERDPAVLASLRHFRCGNSEEVIARSLMGNYREEHLFALRQAVDLYDFYQTRISECDDRIEQYLKSLDKVRDDEPAGGGKQSSRRSGGEKEAQVDMRTPLYQMSGVDLTRIDGIGTRRRCR